MQLNLRRLNTQTYIIYTIVYIYLIYNKYRYPLDESPNVYI